MSIAALVHNFPKLETTKMSFTWQQVNDVEYNQAVKCLLRSKRSGLLVGCRAWRSCRHTMLSGLSTVCYYMIPFIRQMRKQNCRRENRSVIAKSWVQKRAWLQFFLICWHKGILGVMELFYILIAVAITQLYPFVKTPVEPHIKKREF